MGKTGVFDLTIEFLRSILVAIITTFLLLLIFAFVIKFFSIDSRYITLINQIIKTLSVFIAVLIGFKKSAYGWLRGFVFGMIYVVISFVIFSLLNGSFNFGVSLLNDLVLVGVGGMISGIIAVNVKKTRA